MRAGDRARAASVIPAAAQRAPWRQWLSRHRLRLLLLGSAGGLFALILAALVFSGWALALSQRDQSLVEDLRSLDAVVARFHSDAERYLRNAPRDYPDYFRDTTIYYAQLQDDVGQIERLLDDLASPARGPVQKSLLTVLSFGAQAARDVRFDDLLAFWRGYRERLSAALGSDHAQPRLEWAARHIAGEAEALDSRIDTLTRQVQAIVAGHLQRVRLIGQWGLLILLFVAGVGVTRLVRSLILRLGATEKGCEQIARGYFGYQIPDRSDDELSALNMAINCVSTRMNAVLRLLDGIQRGSDMRATAQEVRAALGAFVPVDWLGLYDNDGDSLNIELREQFPELGDAGVGSVMLAQPRSQGGFVLSEAGQTVPQLEATLRAHGLQTAVVLSLPSESGAGFTMVLAAHAADAFSEDARALLHNVAPMIAHGFEKSALSEQLLLAAVNGLSKLAESRDPDTGDHLVRMSQYAYEIAREMAASDVADREPLAAGFARDVLRFAAMHDIGKVGVPDAILLKPGMLSEDERVEMSLHPVIGGSVLRACAGQLPPSSRNLFTVAIEIAEGHHERFDGSGYPAGRRGREIPLAARIVAAADVFDALTSRRPYKEAWSLERGIAYLSENAGRHFDPAVVAAFIRAMPQIAAVYARYRHV